jgi:cellulose biosynthesis protein BcsQ
MKTTTRKIFLVRSIMASPTAPTRIAYASKKAGVGKSTQAVLAACKLAYEGYGVGFVDGDSSSQSAFGWYEKAQAKGDPMPFAMIREPHGGIVSATHKAFADMNLDVIIYDLQGADVPVTMAVMEDVTAVIIVTTTSPFDYEHVPACQSITIAGLAEFDRLTPQGKPSIPLLLQFSRVDGRRSTKKIEALTEQFNKRGLDVIENYLPYRQEYEDVKNHNPISFGVDMAPVEEIINELREGGIIRGQES